ncbi:hypothetical protein HYE67_008811 [Fusarium culmorum]|uniref:Secreted protein n=1 Tax=Fusarium culmorum TaxID=5516 RepID=A0A2T4HBG6_FUSCU|nr:hypothetical protein FCULG_00003515 [Fusarium culmorum]QPC66580.1 hypothetical protein HYE67_008811 [Fusarium culmorum]
MAIRASIRVYSSGVVLLISLPFLLCEARQCIARYPEPYGDCISLNYRYHPPQPLLCARSDLDTTIWSFEGAQG